MSVCKCKMCGGDLIITKQDKVVVCEYCGTSQTVPSADNEKKMALFNRANRLRLNNEFDKAATLYERIASLFPEEAEAYWGLCLCNYGIEYVDDPATGKKIPTCHRASFEKLKQDENFTLAMEYADMIAQRQYRAEAREIDRINEEILTISKNESPYDIFICYKETDDFGERTPDSVMAQYIYDALTEKGYRVFFSRISLEDKLGEQYEPYIFAALNSAKVMLSIGTKYEYFHAVWVKNEWIRFLRLAATDKSKVLIPCYKDMDPYDMPDEFSGLQWQDLGEIGAIQELILGIEESMLKTEPERPAPVEQAAVDSFASATEEGAPLKRIFKKLDDDNWNSADGCVEKTLENDPENGDAYYTEEMDFMSGDDRKWPIDCPDVVEDVNIQQALRCGTEGFNKENGFTETIQKTEVMYEEERRNVEAEAADTFRFYEQAEGYTICNLLNLNKTDIVIPGEFRGKPVIGIHADAFKECKSLTRVTIPNSVTRIGANAFFGCTSLTSVTIPDSVTEIGYAAFFHCKNLTKVIIPDSIAYIDHYAFQGCTNLTDITIPDGVTGIGEYAFAFCERLTSLTIPDSVIRIGYSAFRDCTSLISIRIPDSLSYIGACAFEGCTNLTDITIPDSVTAYIECCVFKGCKGLADTNGFVIVGGVLYEYFGSCDEVTIPDSVTSIDASAFSGCESLKSVTIPDSVTSIGASAFSGCESLKSVTIPDSVTSIGKAVFYECVNLHCIYCHGDSKKLRSVYELKNKDNKRIIDVGIRLAALCRERVVLQTELHSLRALFNSDRRKEVKARIVQIDMELKKIQG